MRICRGVSAFVLACSFAGPFQVHAATTLTAPSGVSGKAGDTTATIAFSTVTSATSYTAKCTSGIVVKAQAGSASPLTVTSLTDGTTYSCSVTASATGYTTNNASSAVSVTPTTYSTPANFSSILSTALTSPTLTKVSGFTTRSRFLISNSTTATTSAKYMSIGSTYSSTSGYSASGASLTSTSTYNDYLSKTFLAVSDSSGYFRLDSHLNPNDSLDITSSSATTLQFHNVFGYTTSTSNGYILFSYDNSNNVLIARKRYKYSIVGTTTNGITTYSAAYTLDSTFPPSNTTYYVAYNNTGANNYYRLVTSLSSATKLYLYNSPLTLGVPSDFNPNATAYSSGFAAPFTKNASSATTAIEGTSGSVYGHFGTKYKTQVAVAGTNTGTETAANSQLATIKSSGVALRYDTAVYAVFRKALLANTLQSESIADGTPGQNLVPYVWFTNEADSGGVYHPFMVIVSYENQSSPNGLIDITTPPCLGPCTSGYRTRFSNLGATTIRIPMKDYGSVSSAVTENTVMSTIGTLWSDVPSTTQSKDVWNFASKSDNGILVNGANTFPAYNNALVYSQSAGELSPSGCHVGQGGGGPHCHADGFRSTWPFGIYNLSDYASKTHPPLIGFGYDGVALFASYSSTYPSMLGYSVSLEPFGGHNHDGIGYHYHAHTLTGTSTNGSYTVRVLMRGAYIGLLDSVPCFNSSTCTGANLNKYTYGN